jgi:hypothetical protein
VAAQAVTAVVFVVAPATPTASGSPASLVPWVTLGEYGRSFVAGATTPAELRAFHGPDGEVLERTGAFDREILGVVTTTGTGWVDPNAASSLEYLHGGDTALVGLQYSYLPSWISFLVDRDEAAEAGVALYRHVHRRWSQLPAEGRAKLVAGSDGALFTGPTASNPIWSQLTDDRQPGSPVWRPVYGGGTPGPVRPPSLGPGRERDPRGALAPAGMDRPPPGLRRPHPGRLVPDRHRGPGGGRPDGRLQRRLRLRPQLRHQLRLRLGGRGPPARLDRRRQRPPPAAPSVRVGTAVPNRRPHGHGIPP